MDLGRCLVLSQMPQSDAGNLQALGSQSTDSRAVSTWQKLLSIQQAMGIALPSPLPTHPHICPPPVCQVYSTA